MPATRQGFHPEAFSIDDFCATYGLGRTSTYELIKEGRLAARKVGRKTLILREDAERWASSLPVLGGAQ